MGLKIRFRLKEQHLGRYNRFDFIYILINVRSEKKEKISLNKYVDDFKRH